MTTSLTTLTRNDRAHVTTPDNFCKILPVSAFLLIHHVSFHLSRRSLTDVDFYFDDREEITRVHLDFVELF